MPHLSRLLAAICAITVILVSLPTDAGIGDKDLPLLNGQKTKLLYTVTGVRDSSNLATLFHCTSTESTSGKDIRLGVEVFQWDGTSTNDIASNFGVEIISPGRTVTLATQSISSFSEDDAMNTGAIFQGSARIFATSKNVLCAAMIVDPINDPPTSMVMLPIFRATKQGGM